MRGVVVLIVALAAVVFMVIGLHRQLREVAESPAKNESEEVVQTQGKVAKEAMEDQSEPSLNSSFENPYSEDLDFVVESGGTFTTQGFELSTGVRAVTHFTIHHRGAGEIIVESLLTAVQEDATEPAILSAPKLLVLEGHAATIETGGLGETFKIEITPKLQPDGTIRVRGSSGVERAP